MNESELYAKTNSNQYKESEASLNRLKDQLVWDDNENVLDVGCGPGNTTGKLLFSYIPKSARLVGIDISVEMIEYAKKNFENARLSFTTLDIASDDVTKVLGSESFSKVFSFYCLQWVPDQRKAIENIWKLMKLNGVGLVIVVSHNSIYDVYKTLSVQSKWKEYMKDVDKFISPYHGVKNPTDIFSNLLTTTGFEVIECFERDILVPAPDIHGLRDFYRAINPFLKYIPQNKQTEFMDDLMLELEKTGSIIKDNLNNISSEISRQEQEVMYTRCKGIEAIFKKT